MKKEEIEHLATLARIALQKDEAAQLATDITGILQYVSEIDEITAEMQEEKNVDALHTVMRDDGEPHKSGIYTEVLLSAAPERDGAYIKVKKILGEDA